MVGNYTRDYRGPRMLHGKQSPARLSDVLISWKQFLRRRVPDKDAAVAALSFAQRQRVSKGDQREQRPEDRGMS